MKTAIYAGSFDPITNGHLDILKNASEIFDKVIIAVSYNINKKAFLTVKERMNLLQQVTKTFSNVEVDSYSGLTIEYAKSKNAKFLIRGLRNSLDFEYEMQMAQINCSLNSEIKTIFLPSSIENNAISSSSIRELLFHNGDISKFVPKEIFNYLLTKHDI